MSSEEVRDGDDEKVVSRRCTVCSIDWPDTKEYKVCPSCLDEEGTSRVKSSSARPLDEDEARSMKLHFEFDRFYEDWDAKSDPARLEPTEEDNLRYTN